MTVGTLQARSSQSTPRDHVGTWSARRDTAYSACTARCELRSWRCCLASAGSPSSARALAATAAQRRARHRLVDAGAQGVGVDEPEPHHLAERGGVDAAGSSGGTRRRRRTRRRAGAATRPRSRAACRRARACRRAAARRSSPEPTPEPCAGNTWQPASPSSATRSSASRSCGRRSGIAPLPPNTRSPTHACCATNASSIALPDGNPSEGIEPVRMPIIAPSWRRRTLSTE